MPGWILSPGLASPAAALDPGLVIDAPRKGALPAEKMAGGYFFRFLAMVLAAAAAFAAGAAEPADSALRPVVSAYMLEAGSAHLSDTYLTPLHYGGWSGTLGYERMQAMRHNPRRNVMRLDGSVGLARTLNPAGSASMWQADFRMGWGMMWRTGLPNGFAVAAGPRLEARLGALSLMRNGNNPVAAKAAATAGVTAMAVWNGHAGRLPLTLRWQPSMPLIGAFFSPDYDELYYEIWLGNHKGLCHCAWPGSYLQLNSLLCADLHFGATTLRLGYRFDGLSSKAAGIVSRAVAHSFVVGVATEWMSLRPGHSRTPEAETISALY